MSFLITRNPKIAQNPGVKVKDILIEKGSKKRTAHVISVGVAYCTAIIRGGKYDGDKLQIFFSSIGEDKSWIHKSSVS